MPKPLSPQDFLQKARMLPVVDVRSPGEFAQGHIPGAVNMPLFTNDERARVGTTYKQVSQEEALLLGLEIVGPKMAGFVRQAKAMTDSNEILVHCWRGGMRSGSVGLLLETAGMKVSTLIGGYKAFRNQVLQGLEKPGKMVVLGGKTGSGKTEILRQLRQQGEQVIDLEDLAHHKGSSFGALGQLPQPTNEQFENDLYWEWHQLDPARRVWVEDESRSVGRCVIPEAFWSQMQQATLALVEMDKNLRIERLKKEYACFDIQLIYEATRRIEKRLGGQHYKAALEALERNDAAAVAEITLTYYDKAYLHGVGKRPVSYTCAPDRDDPNATARQLIAWAERAEVTSVSETIKP